MGTNARAPKWYPRTKPPPKAVTDNGAVTNEAEHGQWRTQIFPTAWATRARRVTHPMPVTLRRLLELKINRNRVLLSAVLCTSIVTLASGSPGQRPGSPGLGSAIGWRHDVAIGLGDYWCYNNRLNFFSGVAMSDSYCCIAFLEGFSLSLFIFFANKE